MGAFRNSWSTSFHIRMKEDLALAEIVKVARSEIPELKRVKTARLLDHVTIIGKTKGGKFLIIGYDSTPRTRKA